MDPPTYPFEETSFMDGPLGDFLSEFSVRYFPFASQDRQDEMNNKQTIPWYFGNLFTKNNQKRSYQNGMKRSYLWINM